MGEAGQQYMMFAPHKEITARSSASRLRVALKALTSEEDQSLQLLHLSNLCELLAMASTEILFFAGIKSSEVMPVLVRLLHTDTRCDRIATPTRPPRFARHTTDAANVLAERRMPGPSQLCLLSPAAVPFPSQPPSRPAPKPLTHAALVSAFAVGGRCSAEVPLLAARAMTHLLDIVPSSYSVAAVRIAPARASTAVPGMALCHERTTSLFGTSASSERLPAQVRFNAVPALCAKLLSIQCVYRMMSHITRHAWGRDCRDGAGRASAGGPGLHRPGVPAPCF